MDLDDEELKATRRMNGSDKNVACMGRNIKLVENLIEEYKIFGDLDGIQDLRPYMDAIEHLIKAYKELKERNKEQADIISTANIAIKDLQEKLKSYIPVSLVEETIEENKGYLEYSNTAYEYTQKEVLEENIKTLEKLLEGKNG